MFGTLKPRRCGLGPKERQAHRALYCGLCQSLGEHHGQLTRPMVSFDAVFLAVIADGLSEEAAAPSQTRCPMVPVVHRATVAPGSAAMRFATHVSVLLADQLLADRAEEGRWLGLARPLVAAPADRARRALAELGVDLSGLQGFEQRQSAVERNPQATAERAAAPTADALALIFGSIASLPGVPQGAQAELQRLGQATGRIIYCVDALEDLRKDLRQGAFNPCLDPVTRGLDPQRRAACIATLREALDEAGRALAALPWQRHRAIAANIVSVEQRRRADQAIARALAVTERDPVSWRALLTRPLLVSWLLWWVFGSAAWAEPRKAKRRPRPEPEPQPAEPAPSAPAPEPAPAPQPEPRVPEAPEAPEVDSPDSLCEVFGAWWDAFLQWCVGLCCGDCIESCGDFCKDCEGNCDRCGDDCGRSCNDCGRGCDDCGKGCNDCGNGCDDCARGCNNCHC